MEETLSPPPVSARISSAASFMRLFLRLPPWSSLFSLSSLSTPFSVHLHHLVSLHSPSWPGLSLFPFLFPLPFLTRRSRRVSTLPPVMRKRNRPQMLTF